LPPAAKRAKRRRRSPIIRPPELRMRAEITHLTEEIEQGLALLRRHL
jgi:hypothetical protein